MAKRTEIRLAFVGYDTTYWLGGINYLKNLLHSVGGKGITPYLFLSEDYDPKVKEIFGSIAKYVILYKNRPIPFILRLIDRFLFRKTNFFLNYYLYKNRIFALSHSNVDYGKIFVTKKIGWIPDFQDKHLPHLFSTEELHNRDLKYKSLIKNSDLLICSSYDALNDLNAFYPGYENKCRVLQFVSNIDVDIYTFNPSLDLEIREKYTLNGKYFYLPNQFWKHKNHRTVFEAVKRLKDEGLNVLVLCSGSVNALENNEHVNFLKKYIDDNNLNDNIRLLGVINYAEVQYFIRNSIAVINPSLFEGWSSTVEECKSLGKNMILSSIDVHKEQNPPEGVFFDPENVGELAIILREVWQLKDEGPNLTLEKEARKNLSRRLEEFGNNYREFINELM